jgi:hypothetical protein
MPVIVAVLSNIDFFKRKLEYFPKMKEIIKQYYKEGMFWAMVYRSSNHMVTAKITNRLCFDIFGLTHKTLTITAAKPNSEVYEDLDARRNPERDRVLKIVNGLLKYNRFFESWCWVDNLELLENKNAIFPDHNDLYFNEFVPFVLEKHVLFQVQYWNLFNEFPDVLIE